MPSARRIGHRKFLGKATLVEPGRIGIDVSAAHHADHRSVHVQSVQGGTDPGRSTSWDMYRNMVRRLPIIVGSGPRQVGAIRQRHPAEPACSAAWQSR